MNKDELKNEIEIYMQYYFNLKQKFELYKYIKLQAEKYPKETKQISCFLSVVLNSLLNEVLINTYKFFDKNSGKNINDLIETITKYIENEYKWKINVIEDIKTRLEEIQHITKNLKKYRDKYLAHSDTEYFGKPSQLLEEYPTKYEDIEKTHSFIENSLNKLLNSLFDTIFCFDVENEKKDYDYILECIRYYRDNKGLYK